MKLNEDTIKHFRSEIIETKKLKKLVCLNESYLKEKPTWYEIENKIQYFKIRNDFRLFTEIFYNRLAAEIMNLQSVEYRISRVRTIIKNIPKSQEVTKIGLLSDNFQNPDFNHYLVSELMQAEISNFISYDGYNLESLLRFFKDYLAEEDYKKNELFLIKLFLLDGFTYQVDRNPNNIAFQIPKLPNISYKERLNVEKLKKNPNVQDSLERKNGVTRLKGFMPNIIYDSERILGVDHKNVFAFNKDNCWIPEFPYSKELELEKNEVEKANNIQKKEYDGLDPNLCSLYLNHSEIVKPYFERLALEDEYRKILEEFQNENSPVILSDADVEYVTNVLQNRQECLKRILQF